MNSRSPSKFGSITPFSISSLYLSNPLMSILQFVSLAASLAFCPSLPIANDNCESGTIILALFSLSFVNTAITSDGLRELDKYSFISLL